MHVHPSVGEAKELMSTDASRCANQTWTSRSKFAGAKYSRAEIRELRKQKKQKKKKEGAQLQSEALAAHQLRLFQIRWTETLSSATRRLAPSILEAAPEVKHPARCEPDVVKHS